MLPLGTPAPAFRLPDTSGKIVSLADFKTSDALLIIFMCNHCPYVKHIRHELAELAGEYQARRVAVVGINSNDAANYPDDSPARMVEEVKHIGYSFPYLYDETQAVAKAYGAVCTPDFFGYDGTLKLQYRGRLDDAGRSAKPDAPRELFNAMVEVARTGRGPAVQAVSMGCSIKWKNAG